MLTTFGAGFPKSQSSGAGGGGDEESESEPPSVEAIAFSPVLPIAVTGSLSGVLGVWDMPTQKLRQRCNHDVSYEITIVMAVVSSHFHVYSITNVQCQACDTHCT